ncbi:MAG: UvrD-helicase domain-containing protein [Ignavibacteriae bacterium]|nr:UvrD-helicase domain-containing protein [Ignavibacteriota bacterium]
MSDHLPNDAKLRFPDFTIVSASAGSGKTHALTLRYLQLLLSQHIPHNSLRNILAITFTNNAATEMKQRILQYLKGICLSDENIIREISTVLSLDQEGSVNRAENVLYYILDHYSDFQVTTIDSFIISVFKATALELGYHPDVEIILNTDQLIEAALEEFSRDVRTQQEYDELLRKIVALMEQSRAANRSYIWDPFRTLQREIRQLYQTLRMVVQPLDVQDYSSELLQTSDDIASHAKELYSLFQQSGLKVNKYFENDLNDAQQRNIDAIIDRKKKDSFVNKPSTKEQQKALEKFASEIEPQANKFYELLSRYALLKSRSYYYPYINVLTLLERQLESIEKREGQLSLDDVNHLLKDNLTQELVPEIYFKLGEKIHHYLIDEFQDTSPIHWNNLKPLLEETLSTDGSLFIVGDTKQSIYGFRGADWRIMKKIEAGTEFASVKPYIRELETNYRSNESIVRFNEMMFREKIAQSELAQAAAQSGLSSFIQDVTADHKQRGYVRVVFLQEDTEAIPEKEHVITILQDCLKRGYRYGDIGILTPANADVVKISSWLNEHSIPFISHSNLDIRRRKSIGEILALLKFLDSPLDDLSFVTFLLSDVFRKALRHEEFHLSAHELRNFLFDTRTGNRLKGPLYKTFENSYPNEWKKFIEDLFTSVGYLPLYDLVSEIYKVFNVFEINRDEETAFTKLLEVVHQFEQKGSNNLKDFLTFAEEGSETEEWDMRPPSNTNAITVMTIHKAKGLGFPVVIVLLQDKTATVDNQLFDEGKELLRLLYVTRPLREKNNELQQVYDKHLLLQQTDMLNKLYVAFTRAMEEMYIVVVYDEEIKGPMKSLPEEEYGTPITERTEKRGMAEQSVVSLFHTAQRKGPSIAETRRTELQEISRGTFIHEVLSRFVFIDGDFEEKLKETIDLVEGEMRSNCNPDEVKQTLKDFLCENTVSEYFGSRKNRQIWTEQEVVNGSGELYRCDRVVVDDDAVTVIDFKTGDRKHEEEYQKQIRNYMNIVREIFPQKDVQGKIAYVDLKQLVSVT